MNSSFEQKVLDVIKLIPRGRVASYGQVAAMCGSPRAARTVGWLLRHSQHDIPWHRVIASDGRISIANINIPASQQAAMLEQEGIEILEKKGHLWVDKKNFWDGTNS